MRRLIIGPAALAALACFASVAAPAASADDCTYDAATKTVTLTHDLNGTLSLVRQGQAIAWENFFGTLPCGDATVRNTDTAVIEDTTINSPNVIDLQGGAFAPGATHEA